MASAGFQSIGLTPNSQRGGCALQFRQLAPMHPETWRRASVDQTTTRAAHGCRENPPTGPLLVVVARQKGAFLQGGELSSRAQGLPALASKMVIFRHKRCKTARQQAFSQHLRFVLLLCLHNLCDFTHNDVTTHYPYRSRHTVLSVGGRYYDKVLTVYTGFREIFDCPGSKRSTWICILIRTNRWRHVVIRVDANRYIRSGSKAGYRNGNLACMVLATHDFSPADNLCFVYLYLSHD